MIVDADYRRHRIEVRAIAADGRWNAEVRTRRTLSQDKPHIEIVTCYKWRYEGRRPELKKRD